MARQRLLGTQVRVSQTRIPHTSGAALAAVDAAATLWTSFAPVIAGGPRVRHGVLRSHGRVEYPTAHERPLTDVMPNVPAAVRVYGSDGCCTALCFDFDAKGVHSPVSAARDEAYLTKLLGVLGLRWISDLSPNGGRHVYVPLSYRLPFFDAREIVEALARRFPTLDPGPHQSAKTGCIRPPGSLHASGGRQELTMALSTALSAVERPNTASEVDDLRESIRGDIEAVRERHRAAAVQALEVDVETPGPVTPISARLTQMARHGMWDVDRYGEDRSAARQAVITGCVAAQWSATDIQRRITDGTWPGLASMYAKYRSAAARSKALRGDVVRAQQYLALNERVENHSNESVRKSNTSAQLSRRGDEHGFIRTWRATLSTFEGTRLHGRRWYAARFLLRALGEAAHKTGSREVAFGCRSLAEATGMDSSTVSVLLHDLEKHGWIKKTARAWGERADTFELTIPEDLMDVANDLPWPKGKIHALRPVFRPLGHVPALVFEAVERERAKSITELTGRLRMARSSVHEAVYLLMSWQLLERINGDLVARPDLLGRVAEYLGADEEVYEQMMRHRRQRALWRAWLARFENDTFLDIMDTDFEWDDSPAGLEIEAA